jgi:hypothetical protein
MSELPNESTVPSSEPVPDYPDTEQPDTEAAPDPDGDKADEVVSPEDSEG